MRGLQELLPPLSEQEALVESARCLMCLRRALYARLPYAYRHSQIHQENFDGKSAGFGAHDSRVESAGGDLRAGVSGAGIVRRRLCAGRGAQADRDRAAAAVCDGLCVSDESIARFRTAKATGKRVAVIGAGPAGFPARVNSQSAGIAVTLFEKRELPGGLSTYGIIVLREPVDIALAEVEMIRSLGVQARDVARNWTTKLAVDELQKNFDAVFLGVGLGDTPQAGNSGRRIYPGWTGIHRAEQD